MERGLRVQGIVDLLLLTVHALRVDPQQNVHAVTGLLGDFGYRDSRVQPELRRGCRCRRARPCTYRCADEYFVPPHTVALDAPVRLLAPGDPGLAEAVKRVGFAQVAFGVDAERTDRISRYEHLAEVRVAELGTHADDEVLHPG